MRGGIAMDGKVKLGKYVAKMTAQWCVYMMLISVFMILVSYGSGVDSDYGRKYV